MIYDSRNSKQIESGDNKCPYCNSLNIKKYLYGYPSYDYDKDKYVLGGCEIGLHKPAYKCMDCDKDLYIKLGLPFNYKKYEGDDYIDIRYNTKEFIYEINFHKIKSIKDEDNISLRLKKIEYGNIYKIEGSLIIKTGTYNYYHDKLMEIIKNWFDEFDNIKLIKNDNIREWSLKIFEENNNISFSEDKKVPSNMDDFIKYIDEIEEFYKSEYKRKHDEVL